MPAASSTAVARKDVVVLPSVPVMPTIPNSQARIAVPPGRGHGQGAARLSSTTSWGTAAPAHGRSTISGRGPERRPRRRRSRGRRRAAPGTATKTSPARTRRESKVRPRTGGRRWPAADRRPPGRPAVDRPQPARGLQPLDQLAQRRGAVGSAAVSKAAIELEPIRAADAAIVWARPSLRLPPRRARSLGPPASTGACGRPRTRGCRGASAPIRSCDDLGGVEGEASRRDRAPGPRPRRS